MKQGQHSTAASKMPTPINPDKLDYHLKRIGYDKKKTEFLVDGFRHGFRLKHEGELTQEEPCNDPSIAEHPEAAKEKIQSEVDKGRMKGPFDTPPFSNFHISPIKLREKTEKGKFRLIHNLSWPYDETSVNGGITEEHKEVKYSSIYVAMKLIMKHKRGAVTRKTDIKDAFKLMPVHPDDHWKLGLKLNGKYYYDITLPMGCASSCQIFEEFTTALQAIAQHDIVQDMTHYLDDFFFIDDLKQVAESNADKFDEICEDIGIPQAPNKKTKPNHITEFLGVNLDSKYWTATLPMDKVQRYREETEQTLGKSKITQGELQQLVGKLAFASLVVPARAFLRRLLNKTSSTAKKNSLVKITAGMREDLKTWLTFLQHYNGVTFFRSLQVVPSTHINMGADASKIGYGATFGKYWIQEKYEGDWRRMFDKSEIGITILELYPIYALMGVFGHKLKNSTVVFHSDNTGVVEVINKQTSTSEVAMRIVRPLVLLLIKHNVSLRSMHVPGIENIVPDTISRFQETEDFLKEHGMNPSPEKIPEEYRSNNFKIRPKRMSTKPGAKQPGPCTKPNGTNSRDS